MSFADVRHRREAAMKKFRAALRAEERAWQDHRHGRIRDRYLTPLLAENARFDRELAEADAAITAALRRLEGS
jgi:hypothetical protein